MIFKQDVHTLLTPAKSWYYSCEHHSQSNILAMIVHTAYTRKAVIQATCLNHKNIFVRSFQFSFLQKVKVKSDHQQLWMILLWLFRKHKKSFHHRENIFNTIHRVILCEVCMQRVHNLSTHYLHPAKCCITVVLQWHFTIHRVILCEVCMQRVHNLSTSNLQSNISVMWIHTTFLHAKSSDITPFTE